MIDQELLAEQLRLAQQIKALTARDLIQIWNRLDISDPYQAQAILIEALKDLTVTYGEISAVAAGDFLEALAESAGRVQRPVALAAVAPDEQVAAMTRWGLGPLFEENPRPGAALKRLSGGTSRLSLQPGRNTVLDYVQRERIRWAFVPQGSNTCPFCLMLASRGSVYHTEQPGYHDSCDCAMTPVREDDDVPQVNQDLQDEWREVTAGSMDQRKTWAAHIQESRNLSN